MTSSPDPTGPFVEALLAYSELLLQINDHMLAFSDAGLADPNAPPRHEILQTLIAGTLSDRLDGTAGADLDSAARAIERSTQALEEELVLVPVEAMARRDVRPLPRRGRRGRR